MKSYKKVDKSSVIILISYLLFSAIVFIYVCNTRFMYEEEMANTDDSGKMYYIGAESILQTIIEPPKTSIGIGILLSKNIDARQGNVYIKLLDNTNNMETVGTAILNTEEMSIEPKYYYIDCEEGFLNNLGEYTLAIECDEAIANNICCYLIDNSSCQYTYGYTIDNNNLMMNMIFEMKMHPAIIYIWILATELLFISFIKGDIWNIF